MTPVVRAENASTWPTGRCTVCHGWLELRGQESGACEACDCPVRLIAEACHGCGAELVECTSLREAADGQRVECPDCRTGYVRTMTFVGYADRKGGAEPVYWPGWSLATVVVS